jgi:hypothetical protein
MGLEYGPSGILRDGRMFIGGGEYLQPGETDHNSAEIYDPVTNTWISTPDGLNPDLGDSGSAILPDGRMLCSDDPATSDDTFNTEIYDPNTNAWSQAALMYNSSGDEESWLSLADGSVLNVYNVGQRYIASTNQWILTSALPDTLVDDQAEIGPALLMYTGQVFVLGATGQTALYQPPATLMGLGVWTAGAVMPDGMGAADTPACVEVNGKVLCVGTPTDYGLTNFFEYDPTTNSFASVPFPFYGFAGYSDGCWMLDLPNGQVLVTDGYPNAQIYTPTGGPLPAWKPTITAVASNTDGSFTVTGTQLNGLTTGSAYGDEGNTYTHYPIVYLTDATGAVHFARTYNFSQMNPSAPGAQETAQFTFPNALPAGEYQMFVNVSGVSSTAHAFTVAPTSPSISGFSPASGPIGTVVSIAGSGFTGATAVRFSGVAASSFVVVSDSAITAIVPTGAVSGPISVTTPGGTGTSATKFTVVPLAVTGITLGMSTIAPGGSTGATVTLNGPAPSGGASVSILVDGFPYSLLQVTAGQSSATATLTTSAYTPGGTYVVKATYRGSSATTTLTVSAAIAIRSFAFAPASVEQGADATGTVTLSAAAPKSGEWVWIFYSDFPLTAVIVEPGKTSATFSLPTNAETPTGVYIFDAALDGSELPADLTVTAVTAKVIRRPIRD